MLPIVTANGQDEIALLSALRQRSGEVDKQVAQTVAEIIENVRVNGDKAVEEYTLKFDGKLPPAIEVSREEINDALTEADPDFVSTLLNSMENIADFHNRQKHQSFIDLTENGLVLSQRIRGLRRVGLSVPSGTAAHRC